MTKSRLWFATDPDFPKRGITESAETIYSFQVFMLQHWQVDGDIVLRLLIAVMLSGLIGWERGGGDVCGAVYLD